MLEKDHPLQKLILEIQNVRMVISTIPITENKHPSGF